MVEKQIAVPVAGKVRPERPRLIVLEGIDLSGRTTQVQLLNEWLMAQQYSVVTTAWRTSPLIAKILTRSGPPLRPLTYSLLYAADHMDRTQRVIKPALEQGDIVLADRYIYTAFARDAARGVDPAWVRSVYRFAVQPDIIFYLHISPEEAVSRRLALQQQMLATGHGKSRSGDPRGRQVSDPRGRQVSDPHGRQGKADKKGKHGKHDPGQTTALPVPQPPALTPQTLEGFHNFEVRMYSEYQQMQKEFGFTVIEGDQPIEQVQAILRRTITRLLLEL